MKEKIDFLESRIFNDRIEFIVSHGKTNSAGTYLKFYLQKEIEKLKDEWQKEAFEAGFVKSMWWYWGQEEEDETWKEAIEKFKEWKEELKRQGGTGPLAKKHGQRGKQG